MKVYIIVTGHYPEIVKVCGSREAAESYIAAHDDGEYRTRVEEWEVDNDMVQDGVHAYAVTLYTDGVIMAVAPIEICFLGQHEELDLDNGSYWVTCYARTEGEAVAIARERLRAALKAENE